MSYMTICAETEDGVREDVLIDSADPPRIGNQFVDEGRTLTRVATTFGVQVSRYERVDYQLPRKHMVAAKGMTPAPHYDSKGQACFSGGKRETYEYMARHNDNENNGTHLQWNPVAGE